MARDAGSGGHAQHRACGGEARGVPHPLPCAGYRTPHMEEALNLAEAQTATAIEVPAEDATPAVPADGANRKRSRVHEIFRKDGLYSFCQCQENVTAGGACGKRIKNDAGTKPLWNHVERFHPRKYLELGAGGHDEIACSATANSMGGKLLGNLAGGLVITG